MRRSPPPIACRSGTGTDRSARRSLSRRGDGDGSRGTRAEDKLRGTRAGRTWPRLVAIACDLARARLYDDVSSDEVSARADRARATLVRLAAGEEALLDAAGRPLSRRDRAAGKGPTPSMSPDSLAGL